MLLDILGAEICSASAAFAIVSHVPNTCPVLFSIFSTCLPVDEVVLCLYSSFFKDKP